MAPYQLSLDLSILIPKPVRHSRHSWRIRTLARRHGIPEALAAVYAAEMGLPVGEAR